LSGGLFILVRFVVVFIDVMLFAFLGRMLVSFFTMGGESRLYLILYYFTEPLVTPVRALCERLGLFTGIPLDIPFFITSLILSVINTVLSNSVL
jgi:uncharacterized protein YggT (Ycf19 family)